MLFLTKAHLGSTLLRQALKLREVDGLRACLVFGLPPAHAGRRGNRPTYLSLRVISALAELALQQGEPFRLLTELLAKALLHALERRARVSLCLTACHPTANCACDHPEDSGEPDDR